MEKRQRRLSKLFFDWMGVLFAVFLVVLALTGDWGATAKEDPPATQVQAQTDGGAAPLIVVDAGHGGADNGASSANGVQEAGINLQVAKLVESGLREAGFTVVMTRTDENALAPNKKEDMRARKELMRQDGVAAIVSVHMNKFRDTTISGPMAFYMKGSDQGEALATCVIEAVCEKISHAQRPANPGDYFVLRESVAPSVIIECGFLSNASDEKKLQNPQHQKLLAEGIVAGIAKYVTLLRSSPTPSASPGASPSAIPSAAPSARPSPTPKGNR